MQPAVVGEVAVTVVRTRRNELDVVGLDVSNGRVVWRYPFYTPDAAHSAYFWPPVFSSHSGSQYVVFQRADTGEALHAGEAKPYVAVDPATGRVMARTKPMVAVWHATPCDSSGVDIDVCLQTAAERTTWRWDLDDFQVHPQHDPHHAGKDGVYTVYGVSGIVTIGRDDPGHPAWSRQVSGLVGSQWEADSRSAVPYVGHGVVVISAVRRPSASQERRFRRGDEVRTDRGRDRTLGLDLRTGRVVWKHQGGELNCPAVAYVDDPVRCVFAGTSVFDRRWQVPRFEHLRLRIEGFDPRTGATTWSEPLTSGAAHHQAVEVYQDAREPGDDVVVGKEVGWLPTRSGSQAVAWNDGSHQPLDASSVLPCEGSVHFAYATDDPPWPIRDTDTYRLCTSHGDHGVAGPPSAAGLAVSARSAGEGRYLVAFPGQLVAYRVG